MIIINWLLDKLPGFIKWPITMSVLLGYVLYRVFLFGYEAPISANTWFDHRWDARAAPYIRERESQFKSLESDLVDIKQDTRDIRNYLMGKGKQ